MAAKLALALALTLATAMLGACSGKQGASGDAASGRLTKAQFIARGDAVCKEIDEVPDTIAKPEDASDIGAFADYLQESLDKTRPKVEQFKALRPPAEDQQVANRLHVTYDQLLVKEGEAITAAKARNAEAFTSAQNEVGSLIEKLEKEASAYGFKVCGA